jgi:adenylate kinase family enzyme
MDDVSKGIGQRVVVTGLAGSGKSTLTRSMAAKTGLPIIHLDLEFWKAGWVAPTDAEWSDKQRTLLADDAWIADGNYHETLDLRVERADTVVVLDLPWPICAGRGLVRGVRPSGAPMPDGCPDSVRRRLTGELPVAWRVWRKRHWEPELERRIIERDGRHAAIRVLRSSAEARAFLDRVGPGRQP